MKNYYAGCDKRTANSSFLNLLKLSISFVGCFKFAGEGYREVVLFFFI